MEKKIITGKSSIVAFPSESANFFELMFLAWIVERFRDRPFSWEEFLAGPLSLKRRMEDLTWLTANRYLTSLDDGRYELSVKGHHWVEVEANELLEPATIVA